MLCFSPDDRLGSTNPFLTAAAGPQYRLMHTFCVWVKDMATTNLFVELIVIGVGAASWVTLCILALFGVETIPVASAASYPVLVVLLPFVYLLGIISDRIADFLFDKLFSGSLRLRYFKETRAYQDARRLVLSSSGRLADMHDYGRTRIRICRGWSLNAVLIAAALQFWLRTSAADARWNTTALTWGTAGCLFLAAASWWSWYMLCSMEYLKIREHADFLRRAAHSDVVRVAA